jgi:cysteine-rich repeat protein
MNQYCFLLVSRIAILGGLLTAPVFAAEIPSPTPTEGFHGTRCGDNIRGPFEGCDDGNIFGGDGCAADCTPETTVQSAFAPILQPITSPVATTISLEGAIVFAESQQRMIAVRSFNVKPVVVPGGAVVCTSGVEASDEFGPGNVGVGVRGVNDSSSNVLIATIKIRQWFTASAGTDQLACTEDDPPMGSETIVNRKFKLSLPFESCLGDGNHDGEVTIDEIITTVANSLDGCPR